MYLKRVFYAKLIFNVKFLKKLFSVLAHHFPRKNQIPLPAFGIKKVITGELKTDEKQKYMVRVYKLFNIIPTAE